MDIGAIRLVLAHAAAVHGFPVSIEQVELGRIALKRLALVGKSNQRDRRPTDDELERLIDHFEGRLLVEVLTWDCRLHVGLSTELTPRKDRLQGGLNYVRSIDLSGRILAPREHRGRSITVHLSPFGPKMRFGPREMDEVGRLYLPAPAARPEFRTTLLIPEDALTTTVVCLSSVWKYLHIWTFDPDEEEASVRAYSFSADVAEKLKGWAAGE